MCLSISLVISIAFVTELLTESVLYIGSCVPCVQSCRVVYNISTLLRDIVRTFSPLDPVYLDG